MSGPSQVNDKDRHAHRPKRNQAVLNLPARKITGCETSEANPGGHGRHQIQRDLSLGQLQQVFAINEIVYCWMSSDRKKKYVFRATARNRTRSRLIDRI